MATPQCWQYLLPGVTAAPGYGLRIELKP